METLIVTGGIATGKSAFCRSWLDLEPDSVFHDADAVVHDLYADPGVRRELARLFGPHVLVGTTEIDRSHVRQEVFNDPEKRLALEKILHPRVRSRCQSMHHRASRAGRRWFLADIPLFFESGCWKPAPGAIVLVVACSPETQLARLLSRNPFDKQQARCILEAQAGLSSKMAAADHVLWNEGRPPCLPRQTRMLRAHLADMPLERPPLYGS